MTITQNNPGPTTTVTTTGSNEETAEEQTPITAVIGILEDAIEDYNKLVTSNNVAAGGRVRKVAMHAINELRGLRKDIQTSRNAISNSRVGSGTTPTNVTQTSTWPPN